MYGIIERIRVFPEKGSAGAEINEGRLVENMGLEGDFHAVGGERQLSLLFTESRERLADQKEKELCFSRFRENIGIRGMTPCEVRQGVRLEAGEAVLEITGETKYCHEECGLYAAGKICALAGMNLFAKVIKGGVIRNGDRIRLRNKEQEW